MKKFLIDHNDKFQLFREYLQNELVTRCKENHLYSLRAFARSLEVDHSLLSRLINKKRKLSPLIIKNLGKKLGLAPSKINEFIREHQEHENECLKEHKYLQLQDDHLSLVRDWYNFAILELMEIEGFKQDPRWISKKIGVNINEIKGAISRLFRLGILEVDSNGKWEDRTNGFTSIVDPKSSSVARKKLMKEFFTLATNSIEEVPISKRNHSGITMAINSKKIDGAKKMITKFRRELRNYLAESEPYDQVYHLSVGLFPITKVDNKENLQ